jgi:hypothetical protein
LKKTKENKFIISIANKENSSWTTKTLSGFSDDIDD